MIANTTSLTNFVDQPGGGGLGVDTQGSTGDDIYTATSFTLQNEDNIVADGGTDTLNVRVTETLGNVITVFPTATGLEKITITDQTTSGGQFNLDLKNFTGVTDVTALDSGVDAGVGFTNIDEGTLVRMVNYDGFLGTNFGGDRSASTDDSFDLYVENSGTEAQSAAFWVGNDDFSTDGSFETANIEIGGTEASFLDADDIMVDTINVIGSGTLNLEDTGSGFVGVETIDASALSGGGINLAVKTVGNANFAFTGSAQDDTFIATGAVLSASGTLSLNAGEGNDTWQVETLNGPSATSVNASAGFEVLRATDNTTALDADLYDDISTFVFAAQTGSQLIIDDVTDGDRFVFEADMVGTADDMLRFRASETDQSVTLELKESEATDGEIRISNDLSRTFLLMRSIFEILTSQLLKLFQAGVTKTRM